MPTMEMHGIRDISVPAKYRRHEQIERRVFYSIPRHLLDLVVRAVGRKRFDEALVDMEYSLSDVNEDHSARVGFAGGQPIIFNLLRTSQFEIAPDVAVSIGLDSEAKRVETTEKLNDRLQHLHQITRGYLGWLLTNSEFLDEHDDLLRRHSRRIRNGCELPGGVRSITPDNNLPEGWRRTNARNNQWVGEFREFCEWWRLMQLVGPYLPQPLQPHLPSPFRSAGGTHFVVPDTFAVDGQGMMREIVSDGVRAASDDPHMSGWFEIVSPENPARNVVGRFARIFELQHFVRILQRRYSESLNGKRRRLQGALAGFLEVSLDTIQNDWKLIESRLGSGWEQRVDPFMT